MKQMFQSIPRPEVKRPPTPQLVGASSNRSRYYRSARIQKIIIADDSPLYREGLKQVMAPVLPNARFIEADSLSELQSVVELHQDANLVLLDPYIPDQKGFTGLACLRCLNPEMSVVIFSGSEAPKVACRALNYGASGFIPKSAPLPVISNAIKAVLAGRRWIPQEFADEEIDRDEAVFAAKLHSLTPKQFKILRKLSDGLLNKQIADDLSINESTVKAHVGAILRKLKVGTRTQAVIELSRLAIAEPPRIWDDCEAQEPAKTAMQN